MKGIFSKIAALGMFTALIFTSCANSVDENSSNKSSSGSSSSSSSSTATKAPTTSAVKDTSSSTNSEGLKSIVTQKYSSTSTAAWGCHDPKLFQDDDGTYYVYSTGWEMGVQIRKSTDLIHWEKLSNSAFYTSQGSGSSVYPDMYWDDDFLKWTGKITNDGTTITSDDGSYTATNNPNSWAPTVIKQNGKYYMFHGIVLDVEDVNGTCRRAGAITLAISDSATGPFIPASIYAPATYSQSTLVRHVWSNDYSVIDSAQEAVIGYSASYNSSDGSWAKGFGAIDPEFVMDVATGNLMTYSIGGRTCYAMTYGSWLGGIALIYVDSTSFKPVCSVAGTSTFNNHSYSVGDVMDAPLDSIDGNQGVQIAGGEAVGYEGAQLIYNSDTNYYYLFVSMGELTYEYRVGVGRSNDIEGPYTDACNRTMTCSSNWKAYHAYGSKIIGAWQFGAEMGDEYGFRSPGGESILRTSDGKILFANHTRTNYMLSGNFCLQIHQMFFSEDGWPLLNMNDYYDEAASLTSLTTDEIAGTYLVNLTERSTSTASITSTDNTTIKYNSADEIESYSKEIILASDGSVSGTYSGTWTLGSDGYSVTFVLSENGSAIGIFKGIVMNAVDWAKKGSSAKRKTVTFTAICESTNSNYKKGEYIFGNKVNYTLASSYTATASASANDLEWYLYPQFDSWTVTVDGTTESVESSNTWWAGQNGHISSKYTLSDGDSLIFYAQNQSSTGGTLILEAYSQNMDKYFDMNPHKQADCWGEAGTITGTTTSTVSTSSLVSLKITIERSGNVYTVNVYEM